MADSDVSRSTSVNRRLLGFWMVERRVATGRAASDDQATNRQVANMALV